MRRRPLGLDYVITQAARKNIKGILVCDDTLQLNMPIKKISVNWGVLFGFRRVRVEFLYQPICLIFTSEYFKNTDIKINISK